MTNILLVSHILLFKTKNKFAKHEKLECFPYCTPHRAITSTCIRGGSRNAATSKMEHFVIIVNGFQLLTIITKSSMFDAAAVLDPPLCALN